jgi:hypothetical protein
VFPFTPLKYHLCDACQSGKEFNFPSPSLWSSITQLSYREKLFSPRLLPNSLRVGRLTKTFRGISPDHGKKNKQNTTATLLKKNFFFQAYKIKVILGHCRESKKAAAQLLQQVTR